MPSVSARQIKAARALLDWSQEDLAVKTRLSISTIRSMELGFTPRASTAKEICNAVEYAGLEFTEGEGVRRRLDIGFYHKSDSCDKLLDDMLQTVEEKGGDVLGYVQSQAMLLQSCGIHGQKNFYRLEQLHKITTVKCVVTESTAAVLSLPPFQFRLLTEQNVSPSYFYVYGNKYVMILPNSDGNFRFIVLSLMAHAQAYQKHFQTLWDRASPLRIS
ncbi:MAG: helix-turn-helix transcriptional regulator [Alphaproteobacteria bacterium]